MTMKIKCIIIDLGDVLIELDFSRFFNEVITPSSLKKPKTPIILEFFRQSDTYHQGKLQMRNFIDKLAKFLKNAPSIKNNFTLRLIVLLMTSI